MILCDFSMVAIANLMVHLTNNPGTKLDVPLIRHITLNALRGFNRQFRHKYGELVLCCDSRSYWRREAFEHYKAGRKKGRDASPFDWKMIFDGLSIMRQEIQEHMPYRVVMVDGAEGDDVIATLAKKYHKDHPILIISNDKDFMQLQKYPNVEQYNPNSKLFVTADDPLAFVKEHILRGDAGDGVPNFLSQDDSFVNSVRQKSINSKKLAEWMAQDPDVFCITDAMKHGYKRNRLLVDLDYIPRDLTLRIEVEYMNTQPASRMTMMNYFMNNDLRSHMESMNDF
jgi:5'-3' exonuclease